MKNTIKLLIISTLCCFSATAQDEQNATKKKYPFVNITEIGGMFGRVKAPSYYYMPYYSSYIPPQDNENFEVINVVNIALQTFNGVYIDPKTAVGITTGVDWYNATLVTPIQLGVRRNLVQRKNGGATIVAGLDAGYGTTWLNIDNPNTKTTGGIAISPTIGYKMATRNGSAWVINFGYKHQSLSLEEINIQDEFYSSNETRNHNRMVVRFGFEF